VKTRFQAFAFQFNLYHYSQGRPLLLEGPAGSGKSATLEEVAAATGNGDFITLHLDAQTDSKSLLGSYVVGAAPGEFKWWGCTSCNPVYSQLHLLETR
jgi:midasin (ATPase involved in ribosome maturation)